MPIPASISDRDRHVFSNLCDIYTVAEVVHGIWSDNHFNRSDTRLSILLTTALLADTQLPSPPNTHTHTHTHTHAHTRTHTHTPLSLSLTHTHTLCCVICCWFLKQVKQNRKAGTSTYWWFCFRYMRLIFSGKTQELPDNANPVHQAYSTVLPVVPITTMFWFHLLRHCVIQLGCIVHSVSVSSRQVPHVSIYRYFEASPFYSRVLCNKKNKYRNDSPAKPWKWTTHNCCCFFRSFWSGSLSLYVFSLATSCFPSIQFCRIQLSVDKLNTKLCLMELLHNVHYSILN